MLRNVLLTAGISALSMTTFAQNVGIGTSSPQSQLEVNGSLGYAISALSSSATLTSSQGTILASPGITLTLPAASTASHRTYNIIYNGTPGGSNVTIQRSSTNNIISAGSSSTSITISEGSVFLHSDGTNWYANITAAGRNGTGYVQDQTTVAQSGGFNLTGNGSLGGNETIGGNESVGGNESITGNETVGGTATITGLFTANGGLTGTGPTNINTSGSGVTNIATGTASGLITIGNTTNNPKIKVPSLTASSVVVTDASSQLSAVTASGSGQVLTSNGSSNAAIWQAITGLGWGLTGNGSTNAGTTAGVTAAFTAGTTNAIGTSDANNLLLEVNGKMAGLVDQSINGLTFYGYQTPSATINTTGIDNTAFGADALFNTVTNPANNASMNNGYQNTAIGYGALFSNAYNSGTSTAGGNKNTAVGVNSLASNTTGSLNVAMGVSSLYYNTTGIDNTALGTAALKGDPAGSTGNYNTAIGTSALFSNKSASDNTAIGFQALQTNSTGPDNTAIGYNALQANTTAGNNTAIGSGALQNNTYATRNTAIGYQALNAQSYSNTSTTYASDNVAIGYQALFSNQPTSTALTGLVNTAVGNYALQNNTTGYYNTALGAGALNGNTTGGQNTAMGLNSAYYVTGTNNTAVGVYSLFGVSGSSTGGNNTGIGVQSGMYATGADNVFIGENAGIGTSSAVPNAGNKNVYIGVSAGANTITGGNTNVAIGYQAGNGNTSGASNTFIGYLAGVTGTSANQNTTGTNNTYIGYQAGPGTTTQLTNAAAIGYNALVTASNSLVLGGTGASAVNVGIGNTAPAGLFSVGSSSQFQVDASGNIAKLNNLAYTWPSVQAAGTLINNGTGTLSWGTLSNSGLTNSSITITAGTGMSGGGAVSLGGTVTLTNAGVTSLTGTPNQVTASASTGAITLSLPQSINTTASPTFGSLTITNGISAGSSAISGNETVGGTSTITGLLTANGGLTVAGATNINIAGAGATNIGTGSASGLITLGNTTNNPKIKLPSLGASSVVLTDASSQLTSATSLGIANGGTGLATTPTNGQLLIGNGTNYTLATITGTTNQVNVANGAGSITLSLPQSINTTATPTFSTLTVSGANQNDLIATSSVKIGSTTATAATAGAGSVQYASGTGLEYSDGTNWNTLAVGNPILNQTTQQASSNFNISGAGLIGTTLGVGTTNTARVLNIAGSYTGSGIMGVQNNSTTGYSSVDFFSSGGTLEANFGYANASAANYPNTVYLASNTTTDMVWATNNTERARITSGGLMGIGSVGTTPTQLLQVQNGNVFIANNNSTAGELIFQEPGTTPSTANYMAFKAQAMAANVIYTLPAADGSSGQLLSTNGTGTLSWSSIGNSQLTNSSVTVSPGTGMSGGGTVSLGGTITLTNAGVTSITGTANQVTASASTGGVTLSLPQSIATSSAPTFAGATLSAVLNANGGVVYPVATKTANYTLGATDYVVEYTGTSNGVTFSLPTASSNTGRVYVIINATSTHTLSTSTYTVSGGTTATTVATGANITLVSDGTVWRQL